MNTVTAPGCSFCGSRNTIRTDHTVDCEQWYCYQCRRGYELSLVPVQNAGPAPTDRHPATLREFRPAIRQRPDPSNRR